MWHIKTLLTLWYINQREADQREVSKYVWDSYEAELRDSGDVLYMWQYDIPWAAQHLRREGTLKPVNRCRYLPWELALQE